MRSRFRHKVTFRFPLDGQSGIYGEETETVSVQAYAEVKSVSSKREGEFSVDQKKVTTRFTRAMDSHQLEGSKIVIPLAGTYTITGADLIDARGLLIEFTVEKTLGTNPKASEVTHEREYLPYP